ncbi:other/Haspin protein kinase [Mycena crocata]|nr:other/Haspin protein kinase [Mycena crocata]
MLGYHTKQINAYGKRRQRIVNEDRLPKQPPSIFDDLPAQQWAPVASRMKKRENGNGQPKAKSQSPKILQMHRKKRLSPPVSRKTLPQFRRLEEEELLTPSRRPLGNRALNTPGSPAILSKAKFGSGKNTPMHNFSPFVDILILDDQGKTISQERRVSGPIRVGHILAEYQADSDSEDDMPLQPKPPRRLRRLATVRVESDESDSDDAVVEISPIAPPIPAAQKRSRQVRVESDESDLDDAVVEMSPVAPPIPVAAVSHRLQVEVVIPLRSRLPPPPAKEPPLAIITPPHILPPTQLRYQHFASPIPRARPLTPIGGRGRRMYAPPSPPSPLTSLDSDLSFDLSGLDISAPIEPARLSLAEATPAYLAPLLAECGQSKCGLHEFSAFIQTFPLDPLVAAHRDTAAGFRKIGEASYSEVYGIGDVVLKIIPLRDETQRRLRPSAQAEEVEGPAETDAKDVLKEIIVTHAMGEVCNGFVKLLRTYIVKGTYPQVLLELWDAYYQRKGSEGVRPDTFTVSQAYAIIVLPNGGPDLEAYAFKTASKSWKQACSIFWQVAKALAHAEQLVSFEHRDLHLGQILVKDAPATARPLQSLNPNRKSTKLMKPFMDDPVHGVHATVIDLGLSRMDAGDGSGGEMVHWTPFEEEIFMGEGDYQFDIYRYMREHNGNNWEGFSPLTNAMWLHYLTVKLLKSKGLKAPTRRKSQAPTTPNTGFTERDCYECMLDLEDWLGKGVAAVAASCKAAANRGKGRKKKAAPAVVAAPTSEALLRGPLCAGEVVGYGVKKGWVKSLAGASAT